MIGIFDSGVGGLGVLQEIVQLEPNANIVYVAGNRYLPFGEKTEKELQAICEKISRFMIEQHDVKLIVVACNTATVSSINYLRSIFDIPFVGIVPVIKPVCEKTKTGCVAVLSTPFTSRSLYMQTLLQNFSNGVKVFNIECPELADLIEQGNIDSGQIDELLLGLISPAIKQGVDTIGLCCTHYSFIKEKLKNILKNIKKNSVTIIDANVPVAQHVVKIMGQCNLRKNKKLIFYATKDINSFKKTSNILIKDLVSDIQPLDL